MSDTAEVGIRIMLEDLASAGLDLITEALAGLSSIAPAVSDDIKIIADSMMDLGAAAEMAVTPLEDIIEAMGSFDKAAIDVDDSNKLVEESLFKLSDAMELMGQTYQMYSDNVDKAVAANDLLDVSLQLMQGSTAGAAAGVASVGTASAAAATQVDNLGKSEDDASDKTSNHTSQFMQQMAVYQSSQATYSAFSGALEGAVKSAGDLQEALTNIQIATGASDKDMVGMENTLIAVANNSKFTAVEVGQAFTLIAERGFTASNIVKDGMGLAATQFAEAVHGQLIPSTTLLTGTMQVFGAKAQDAERYASALTFAFYHGIPDVNQLQEALANVAGEAHALNIPIEDVTASLDFLVQHGLSASVAGNSLRYMLSSLTDPTSKASQELAALGIESINASGGLKTLTEKVDEAAVAAGKTPAVFDGTVYSLNQIYTQGRQLGTIATDQSFYQWAISAGYLNSTLFDTQGNLKPLPGLMQEITDSINKLPNPEQKMAALGNVYNVRSGQGAIQFTNDPNANQKVTDLSAGTKKAEKGDLAGQDATRIMGDFNSKLAALQTSWTTFVGVATAPILGVLSPVLGILNNLVLAAKNGGPEVQKFVEAFLLFGTLGAAVGVLYGLVTLFTLTGVLLAGGVVVAVIGFAALGGLIYANWNSIAPVLQNVGNAIASVGVPILALGAATGILWGLAIAINSGVVPAFFTWIAQGIVFVATNALDMLAVAGLSIVIWASMIPALLGMAAAFLIANWPIILIATAIGAMVLGLILLVNQFGGLNLIMKVGAQFLHQIGDVFVNIGNQIKGQFMAAMKQLQPTWAQLVTSFTQAKPIFMFLGGALAAIISIVLALGVAIINGLLHALVPLLGGIIGMVAGIIRAFMGVLQFFTGFFTLLGGLFTGNTTMIQQGWDNMGKGLYNIAAGFWNVIKSLFTGVFGAIMGFFGGFISGFFGFLGGLMNGISSGAGNGMIAFGQAIISGIKSIPQHFTDFINWVLNAIGGLGPQLFQSMVNAMTMLGNGAMSMLKVVLKPFEMLGNAIMNILGFHSPPKEGPLADSDQYMPNFMKMMATGIIQHKHLVHNAMGDVASGLTNLSTPSIARLQSASAQAGSMGTTTFNLQIDSKRVSQLSMDNATGQLKMQGLGRAWR